MIINSSFQDGILPEIIKAGKVIPLFKGGKQSEIGNYRPISLLPQFGKIFEKLFINRLESFLTEKNIISDSQFGFRKKLSNRSRVN